MELRNQLHFLSMIRYGFDRSDASRYCGIYCILIGNRTYIGSTKRNIWVRIKEHEQLLIRNKHYNCDLQKAYNEVQDIVFLVIEYCDAVNVCKREQYYISKWKPNLNIVKKVAYYK